MSDMDDIKYGLKVIAGLLALLLGWTIGQTLSGSPASPDIVALTITYESSGEPFDAQVQVANVIRTRAIERKLTPRQVCLQKRQFSCWNKGAKLKPRTTAELRSARRAWEASAKIKHDVNLYHDTSVTPWWAKSKKVRFVRQIGRLKFYKEKR